MAKERDRGMFEPTLGSYFVNYNQVRVDRSNQLVKMLPEHTDSGSKFKQHLERRKTQLCDRILKEGREESPLKVFNTRKCTIEALKR